MLNYFKFNGGDSRDYGVLIRNKKTYNQAEKDITFEPVAGRSGDIVIDNGRYNNVEMGYGVTLFAPTLDEKNINQNINLAYSTQDLKDWLIADGNYYKLTDCYDPDYYRMACYSGGMEFETFTTNIAKTDIIFNCKPYKYRNDGENLIEINHNSEIIYNPEAHNALPYIKIYGINSHTTTVFSINGKTYILSNVDGYVEMDCEMQNVFKDTIPKNNTFQGQYLPTLSPGKNKINFISNIAKIEIIPKWRTI